MHSSSGKRRSSRTISARSRAATSPPGSALSATDGRDRDRELAAHDRGDLREPARTRLEAVDPRHEEGLERGRQLRRRPRRDRPRPPPVAAGLHQRADELLDVQRVPLGLRDELVPDGLAEQSGRHDRIDQLARGVGGERSQRQLLGPVRELALRLRAEHPSLRSGIGAKGHGEHHGRPVGEVQEALGQLAGRPVRPVQVVQCQDERALGRHRLDPGQVGIVLSRRQLVGREREQLAFLVRIQPDREQQAEVRQDPFLRRTEERADPCPKLHPHGELGIALVGTDPRAQHVDEGPERRLGPVRRAPALEPGGGLARPGAQLLQHPRLAEPGLADDQQDVSASRLEILRGALEAPELASAADERRDGPRFGGRPRSHQARRGNRSLPSLDGQVPERLQDEDRREPGCGPGSDRDRSGLGRGLQPGRDVRRVSQGHGLRVLAADDADRRRAAVQPDPHAETRDAPRRLDLGGVSARDPDDPERGSGRTLRVVLVRDGNAEVRADPVAHVRLDDAAVLLDRAAHPGHELAHERLHLVRTEALAEPGRADDVGEQGRDGPHLVASGRVGQPEPPRARA